MSPKKYFLWFVEKRKGVDKLSPRVLHRFVSRNVIAENFNQLDVHSDEEQLHVETFGSANDHN